MTDKKDKIKQSKSFAFSPDLIAEPELPEKEDLNLDDEYSAQESQSSINFDDQCYLMSFWRDYTQYHKMVSSCCMCRPSSGQPEFSPENITLLDVSYPEKITSLFEGFSDGFDIFKELTPAVQSLLTPKLRLYKVYPRGEANDRKLPTNFIEFEIPFPQIQSARNLGHGAAQFDEVPSTGGIKSFSYKFLGGNPLTIDKYITSKLVLIYASIDEFFQLRSVYSPEGAQTKLRHSDMIMPRGLQDKETKEEQLTYDGRERIENFIPGTLGSSFWTRAEVGWATPSKAALSRVLPNKPPEYLEKLILQIKKASSSLLMSYSMHSFDIRKDGSIQIEIDFTAHLESTFSSTKFDIFRPVDNAEEVEKELKSNDEVKIRKKKLLDFIKAALKERRATGNMDGRKCADLLENNDQARFGCGKKRRPLPKAILGGKGDRRPFPNSSMKLFEDMFKYGETNDVSIRNWLGWSGRGKWRQPGEKGKIVRQRRETNAEGETRKMFWANSIILAARNHKYSTDNLRRAKKALEEDLGLKRDKDAVIHEIRARIQLRKYRRIMEKLYQSGRVYFTDITLEDVDRWRERLAIVSHRLEWESQKDKKDKKPLKTPEIVTKSTPPRDKKKKGGKKKPADTRACRVLKNYALEGKESRICNIKACLQSEAESEEFKLVSKQRSVNIRRINFVYFADIIDIAVGLIFDDAPANRDFMSRTRILIGNILLTDYRLKSSISYSVNLGDLPVSVQDFMTWFQKKCTDRGTEMWTLRSFIMDCANELLFAALGETCIDGVKQAGSPTMVNMSSYGVHTNMRGTTLVRDPIPRLPRVCLNNSRLENIKRIDPGEKPPIAGMTEAFNKAVDSPHLSSIPGIIARPNPPRIEPVGAKKLNARDIFHYMYLYGETEDVGAFDNDEAADAESGVFHFNMGVAGGFLKDIKFKKNTFEELRTKRIVDSSRGSLDHIYDPYDANLVLYGNAYFKPGMYIYINKSLPSSYGRENSNYAGKLGLGGYYFILEVEHIIQATKYETLLNAKWQSAVSSRKEMDPLDREDDFHNCWDSKKIKSECKNYWQGEDELYNWFADGNQNIGYAVNSDITPVLSDEWHEKNEKNEALLKSSELPDDVV